MYITRETIGGGTSFEKAGDVSRKFEAFVAKLTHFREARI